MNKVMLLTCILIVFNLNFSQAATMAITEDGKKIVLNENGTWNFQVQNKSIKKERTMEDLSYQDDIVRVSVQYFDSSEIDLAVTSVSKTKIIHPKTYTTFRYGDGSGDVGGGSWGFSLKDSYGNNMELSSVVPIYFGIKEKGLQFGETIYLKIATIDKAIESADYLVLNINKGVLGSARDITF